MAKQTSVPNPAQINMIGEGTELEGTLRAHSDVRVSGRIIGKLFAEGKVSVAQEGFVDGELEATSADVAGTVKGHLRVKERLVLKGSARIEGTIQADRLVMEEGATFDGEVVMTNGKEVPVEVTSLADQGAKKAPSKGKEA